MNIFTDPETFVLWLILLLPVFLSLILTLYVRYLTSKYWYKGEDGHENDEEMAYSSTTTIIDPPPPSYIASYRDQLFSPPLLDHEKPPDYQSPPSYNDNNEDEEEITLDQVKQKILLQKRQRELE